MNFKSASWFKKNKDKNESNILLRPLKPTNHGPYLEEIIGNGEIKTTITRKF